MQITKAIRLESGAFIHAVYDTESSTFVVPIGGDGKIAPEACPDHQQMNEDEVIEAGGKPVVLRLVYKSKEGKHDYVPYDKEAGVFGILLGGRKWLSLTEQSIKALGIYPAYSPSYRPEAKNTLAFGDPLGFTGEFSTTSQKPRGRKGVARI
jgi:hypothetical protein